MKHPSRLSRIVFTCLLAGLALSGAVHCGSSDGGGGSGSSGPFALSISVTGFGSGHVTSSAGNIDCTKAGGTCTASLNGGTTVTLTAIPDPGFFFNGWLGACHGGLPCTLTLSQVASVQASFVNIAFSSNRDLDPTQDTPNPTNTENIWLVNTDGSQLHSVAGVAVTNIRSSNPTFSPDGNQLVFISNRDLNDPPASSISAVWVANADGSQLHPLARFDGSGITADFDIPRWSPDGNRIVFTSNQDIHGNPGPNINGNPNSWVVNSDNTGLQVLAGLDVVNVQSRDPVWSPDGTKIAFDSTRNIDLSPTPNLNETDNVWVINADGSGLKALTKLSTNAIPAPQAFGPQWSPDGSQIAFVSDRSLGQDPNGPAQVENIWKMDADGSNPVHLTADTGTIRNDDIQWSPDGQLIIFRSNRDPSSRGPQSTSIAVRNTWAVAADGSEDPFPLTALRQASCSFSYWAPDSSVVISECNRNPIDTSADNTLPNKTPNIWIVKPDGSGDAFPVTDLTNAGVFNASPFNTD